MATEASIQTTGQTTGSRFDSRAKKMLVSAICFCGAAYSSYLLYQDITSRGVRVGTPMAKLERTESHVRMKPNNSFVWSNAALDEDLYRKDSIQTSPSSAAAVRFKDGSLLEVDENSLIVIDNMSDLALNFVHGTAVLRTSAGDSKITVDEGGKAKIEKLPARLVKPLPLSEIFVSGDTIKPVEFAWELTPKAGQALPSKVKLQVSPDRHFKSKDTLSFDLAGEDKTSTVPLPAGGYYWRLQVENEVVGEPSRFRIESINPLKPLYPTAGQQIPAFGDSAEVPFRWNPPSNELADELNGESDDESSADASDEADKASSNDSSRVSRLTHKIEVSTSSDFKSVVAHASVSSSSGLAHLSNLPDGVLYWRMVSSVGDTAVKSSVEKFELQKLQKVDVELLQPEQKASLQLQPQSSFSWNSESTDVGYRWQVRKAGTEKVQSESAMFRGRSIQLKQLKGGFAAGQYEWRVQAFMKDHAVGESPWREVSFFEGSPTILQFPTAHQEFHFWENIPQFTMKWSPDEKVESGKAVYQVEIANDPEFKNAEKIESHTASLRSSEVKWKDGAQFWRVSVLDSSNKEPLKTSSASEFVYGAYPTLRAPASVKPESGAIYNPLRQTDSFVVNWATVENAQGYGLTVKSAANQVVYRQVLRETRHEFKGLKPGKYTYTVSTVDPLKRAGEATQARQFEVTYGEVLGAPEAVSPEVQ
jgi:hypothetical protein